MNTLLGRVLRMAFSELVKPSLRRVKIRAAIYYLQTIQTVRRSLLLLGALVFCLMIMAGGAVLIPLGLCLFMPWQSQTKALVICAVGAVYLVAPLIVASVLLSEKRWMRMTRADVLVKDILSKQ